MRWVDWLTRKDLLKYNFHHKCLIINLPYQSTRVNQMAFFAELSA